VHEVEYGPLAQLAEQQTLNLRVAGSMPARLIGAKRDGESRPAFILYYQIAASARYLEVLTAARAAFTMRRVGARPTTREWWNGRHARLRIWCLAA
jgi:hypothetical protein